MSRRKLLVAAILLGLPLAACEEGTKPPPVGEINGQVLVEREGVDGITVTLSSGAATTTSGGGHYKFTDVEGGTYTVTISGFPDDASFDQTSVEVTITQPDQAVNRNFNGSWIRTASLMGTVTVEGKGLPGITVSISGRQEAQMPTDANGQYTFTGLRAGNYSVEISGFDPTDVAFSSASSTTEVAVGATKVVPFAGTYVRESTISGQVSVEGNGLSGVTVSLQGMGADEEETTDAGGQYTFSNLRAGEYQVAISGFDTREYGFSSTSATVRVEHGRTANVPFEGIMLRTASIMGTVTVEGEALPDVTVRLRGEGEDETTRTDTNGQYSFSDLPAGNFQVGITGYDPDDYSFETTSKNVALALGETATVPFEGVLLRTSGISGRVSVEGEGLDSVKVTLSGDDLEDDITTMTDASGQYAFAGLAEGDYTVAISGYDNTLYAFADTDEDVDLGDDDTEIVNFMGTHIRTASISGTVYVDEAGKNDEYDDGEAALAVPGITFALIGGDRGILNPLVAATDKDGEFTFENLRAGTYQLALSPLSPVPTDYAFGGSAIGYALTVGVGESKTQDVPFDITHQTINFTVTLRRGGKAGPALPGAKITLYQDDDGEQRIGTGTTDDDGMATIRFARAEASGHKVYAGVAAPAGSYEADDDMQSVSWDPKNRMTDASNSGDIVNTMASFSFGGATRKTDFGGGKMLGGWKVSVMSGDKAVAGAPAALGANGMAKFSETVATADMPKTYEIEMAGWKAQPNDTLTGDGGERHTSTTIEYTHDGLSLAGTSVDAGMLEVTYTTQKLRVYVHQENDQVMGFTGNVLGGDKRKGEGIIDVDIRYLDGNGRSRAFASKDSVKSSRPSGGVYTFSNVPAAANVIVTADEVATLGKDKDGNDIANTNHLLDKNGHSDEVAAYTGKDANGIMGSAFGAEGGFHHTVDLCPLMSDAGNQRHGECSTFAFVETFAVDGQAWMYVRNKSGDDFASANSKAGVKGLTVSMDPVDGENLAMEDESFTAKTASRLKFDFGHMPAGVYKVTVPTGWIGQRGPLESPTNDLAARLNPLDSALNIDVTPKTGYAYGAVTDSENRRLAGVTVNVNGVSVTTDSNGRYVASGFGAVSCRIGTSTLRNQICVNVAEEGSEPETQRRTFRANSPTRIDVEIEDATQVTMINGRVTHSNGGAGVGGVRVWVDGKAPLNPNTKINRSKTNNAYVTNSNGDFSVRVRAKEGGASAAVTVSRDGMFFSPDKHTVGAVAGATISGINFTAFNNGTIRGRVVDAKKNPISGVIVKATQVSPGTATDADTTGTTGTYSLSVRYGQYSVSATKAGYTFTDTTGVNVPNDGKALKDLIGTPAEDNANLSALTLSGVSLCRGSQPCGRTMGGFRSAHMDYTATVGNSVSMTTVTATPSVPGAKVTEIYPGDDDDKASGHQVALAIGRTDIEIEVVSADKSDTTMYTVAVTRLAESTTITGTVTDKTSGAAISGVRIVVSDGLIGGFTDSKNNERYVSTNAKGEYKANVESGSGSTTLTPKKTSGTMYSFDPPTRSVARNAGTVSGLNFKGSKYATISGTVVAGTPPTPLEGARVTATSGGESESDDTDRRGRFRVSVPAGTATITAAKAGYDFPEPQRVALNAGESRSGVVITAGGNLMPLNVMAERDTTVTDGVASYDGTATVKWDQGVSGAADAYQAQRQDGERWEAYGELVTALTDGKGSAAGPALPNGSDTLTVTFRVLALTDTDPSSNVEYGDTLISATAVVRPVNPAVSNVAAERDTETTVDSLIVTWDAIGDADSHWRVLVKFGTETKWYVMNADAGNGRDFKLVDDFTALQALASGGTAKTPDADDWNGALTFRVDYRQQEKRGDSSTDVKWKTGPTASVAAKPSG